MTVHEAPILVSPGDLVEVSGVYTVNGGPCIVTRIDVARRVVHVVDEEGNTYARNPWMVREWCAHSGSNRGPSD